MARGLNAQTQPADTLKKTKTDTVSVKDNDETLDEKVTYSAEDSVVALPGQGKAMLYGKAKIIYGSMNLEAAVIEMDYVRNTVIAYGKKDSTGKNVGNPVFKDGEETMEADKIMYNLKTKKGKIFNALTHQGELLVIGSEIKKDSTNTIYMKDMKCIPCKDADSRTIFRATKAKIIPNDKIVTGPMYLEIGGAPTPLGLPFGYFPNTKTKHNGILLPTFGNSPERGFYLQNGGFYIGINDKTDMTIRGDIYGNGSFALRTDNRYKVLYRSSGNLGLQFSQFNIGDPDIPAQYSKQRAFQVNWSHTQDNRNNPSVRFSANVNIVGNQQYNRLQALNSGEYLQNTFMSNINFTKSYRFGSLSLNASHSQNTNSRIMDITLPALTFNVNRFFPFKRNNAVKQNVLDKIGISYLLEAKNTITGRDSTLFKGNLLDSLNYGIRHSIPINTNFNVFKYITVTPGIDLSSVMYMKHVEKTFFYIPGSVVVTGTNTIKGFTAAFEGRFSTKINTNIYYDYMFKKGKLTQLRHRMSPDLTYSYRPDFGSPQYGYWRQVMTDTLRNYRTYSIYERGIYGGPATGKVNALTLSINNTLDAKLRQRTDTGITYKKVALLQGLLVSGSYNFAADSFNMSDISLTARTLLFKNVNITFGSAFNPYAYQKGNGETAGRIRNVYVQSADGRLARFTHADVSVNTSIGSNMLEAAKKAKQAPEITNGAERGAENDLNARERMPWNLTVSYVLSLDNPNDSRLQPTQQLNLSGDLMPTKYWKLGVSTGFDFRTQRLSYTSLDIYRDLKCWEARIRWIPFGFNKSYSISINLKTSMLSEFKIPRQRQYLDTFR